jgi:hypothetical protein
MRDADAITASIRAWSRFYEGDETDDEDVAHAISIATAVLPRADLADIVRSAQGMFAEAEANGEYGFTALNIAVSNLMRSVMYRYREQPEKAQRVTAWFKAHSVKYEAAWQVANIDTQLQIFAENIHELIHLWAREEGAVPQ